MDVLRRCWNWKVLAGLGVVGLAVYVLAPSLVLGLLPILALLACPLSMVLMMRGMNSPHAQTERASVEPRGSISDGLPRDQQVALLRLQLRQLGEQQAALAQQIASLEAGDASTAAPAAAEPSGTP